MLCSGYLPLDPAEWIRAVEKRRAALGRRGEWQQKWQQTQLGFPGVAGNPR